MKQSQNKMKKIEAIIRSSRFDEVKEALSENGINFFTDSDRQRRRRQINLTLSYKINQGN